MKKFLAAALLSTVIAAPAMAQQTPIYVGALAGDQFVGVLGGYHIDKMFAVEGHYTNINVPDISAWGMTTKTDSYNAGVSLVVTLPWGIPKVPALSFFVRGGIERTNVKASTYWGGTYVGSVSANSTDLALGGGAHYQVTKQFTARAGVGVTGEHTDLYVAGIYRF